MHATFQFVNSAYEFFMQCVFGGGGVNGDFKEGEGTQNEGGDLQMGGFTPLQTKVLPEYLEIYIKLPCPKLLVVNLSLNIYLQSKLHKAQELNYITIKTKNTQKQSVGQNYVGITVGKLVVMSIRT